MKAYYNEFDPKAAAWLRELIKAGHIAPGDVDERPIQEVKPDDLRAYAQCHFFAGIGGWSLALRMAGVSDDKRIWTGSCPCQPFSDAGQGLAENDPRHLWPVWWPLIRECGPSVVLGEQVASKSALRWLDGVFSDLEGQDYACGAADLCAAGLKAPHIRQRLWWVAHTKSAQRGSEQQPREQTGHGRRGSSGSGPAFGLANIDSQRLAKRGERDGKQEQSGLESPRRDDFGGRGGSLRLANHESRGCGERRDAAQSAGVGHNDGSGVNGWMGSPIQPGLQGHARHGDPGREPGRLDSRASGPTSAASRAVDWDDFEIAWCRDPKGGPPIPRRIKPATFPLVDGLPGRVGILRGAGNAIVPQAAAEFIRASFEAIEMNQP